MASNTSRKRAVDPPVIPDRLYFKIGDVARLCAVEPYVLRFWETQFPQLKPNKSGTGQRLYRRREVELALEIKRLVHEEGYTISGARHAMEHNQRSSRSAAVTARTAATEAAPQETLRKPGRSAPEAVASALAQIRAELREIASMLSTQQPKVPRARARVVSLSPESGSLFPL